MRRTPTAPTSGWSGRSIRSSRSRSPSGSARCRSCRRPARSSRPRPATHARTTASSASRRSTSGAPRRAPASKAPACRTASGSPTTSRSWAAGDRSRAQRARSAAWRGSVRSVPTGATHSAAGCVDSMSIAVELRDVSRSFGDVRAVDSVSLAIDDGEFFSMLGPSGSGKTTCLRLIGGFDLPTAGQIFLHGTDASDLPPYERDVNTVFQDYALFPHLSVLDNVAYGLRMRGIRRAARRREAAAALEQVALGGLGGRHPGQLSGGQRQRVALARALVNRPRVLLLD